MTSIGRGILPPGLKLCRKFKRNDETKIDKDYDPGALAQTAVREGPEQRYRAMVSASAVLEAPEDANHRAPVALPLTLVAWPCPTGPSRPRGGSRCPPRGSRWVTPAVMTWRSSSRPPTPRLSV